MQVFTRADHLEQGVEQKLFGHPRGLFVLFLTEVWERFSYHGTGALLVYYMVKQLMFTQGQASQIYGLYTGLVYLTPFFGGIIADRAWGQRKTVIVGGVLMAIGHFLMAFESLFFLALLFLILGNGAFKPNISTQVGNIYAPGDPRRDRAFGIFYMGINLGAFFSPLVCGTLGELYGWHYGFGAAGVGMVVGLSIYLLGQSWLAPDNLMVQRLAGRQAPRPLTAEENHRLLVLIVVCLITVAFWEAYEQQGNTVALWANGLYGPGCFRMGDPRVVVPVSESGFYNPRHSSCHQLLGVAVPEQQRALFSRQNGDRLLLALLGLPRARSRGRIVRSGRTAGQHGLAHLV